MDEHYDGSMKPARMSGKAALAAEAWRTLFEFFMESRPEREAAMAKSGLTPNDAKALFTLDEVGKPMGALAGQWLCDASNATWIVDRLEKRGLAERRSAPADRRVKNVVLTSDGVRVREEMMREFFKPPAELLELDRKELETLRDAMAHLTKRVKARVRDRGAPQESSA